MHLSRLAEELVIWTSAQFRFVTLSDRFSTGSSIMPQKKNPDAAELIRAKIGRILGANVALLTVMKGLPLTYSKDMQEDKEQVFDAADTLMLALAAMDGMVRDMQANVPALEAAAASGFSTATDLADWLVRELDMPFRDAHHVTGTLVAMAEARGCDLPDLSLEDMTGVEPRITEAVFDVLGVHNSVASRTSYGGHGAGSGTRAGGPMGGTAGMIKHGTYCGCPLCLPAALVALAACGVDGEPEQPTRARGALAGLIVRRHSHSN
jgi:argininosuccinate lyase